MSKISVIVVDDDENIYTSIRDLYDASENFSYSLDIHKALNREDAHTEIERLNSELDLAIIDLKLDSSKSSEFEGNQVIEDIVSKIRVPIIVHSATPKSLSQENEKKVIKTFTKGCEITDILKEIDKINNTGIFSILGRRGKLEELINKIYWDSFSNNLYDWQNHEHQLLRHFAAHLHKELEYIGEKEDNFLPSEFYVNVSSKHMTGNIYKKDIHFFITLTPSCDFAQSKAQNILLVKLEPTEIDKLLDSVKVDSSGTEIEKVKNKLRPFLSNKKPRYHYLPSTKHFSHSLINFEKVSNVPYKELDKNYEKILTVSPHFTKDIINRFSSYFSRQGSPDFDSNLIINDLLNS